MFQIFIAGFFEFVRGVLMKKFLSNRIFILLTFAILFGINSFAFARNIEIFNHTGRTIYEIYISSNGVSDSNWGGNILGSKILYNGESTTLKGYKDVFGSLDFRIGFGDKYYYDWNKYDFTGAWRVTIIPNGYEKYRLVKN